MLGERGRWIGVAIAVLVLGGIGAALLTAKDSSTATQAAAPARATTTTAAAASATTTTSDTPVLRALHPAAGKFKPDGTTIDSCKTASDFRCYEQAIGNIAFNEGDLKAFEVLNGLLQSNNEGVRADCHTITHNIGSATLARYKGDAAEAIGSGGAMQDATMCGSGFYHGLIEYALREAASPKALVAKVKGMCADHTALPTTFARYQCLHGLGHGVMIFSGDNLPWALGMCDKLGDSWSEQSCSGGVFMQNFNPPDKLSPFQSIYVKKNDLLYPCDWVRTKYKFYCYLQITQHILAETNYDWKRAAATCSTAPAPWNGICFQSYGRDASGASHYHADVADGYCKLTGKQIAQCIYGVARDFANNDAGGTRAADFCNLQSAGTLRGFCFYAVGTILGTLGHPDSWIKSTCATLAGRYAPECAGKVDAAEYKLINNGTPGA
jgi:hypothetical protein